MKPWTGLTVRPWMETSGRLLWTRQLTFRFHKTSGISWSAEELSASQDERSSVSTGGVRRSLGNPSLNPLGSVDQRRGENGGESDRALSLGMRNGASYGHKTKTLADNAEGSLCVAQLMWFIYPVCTTPKHMLGNKMKTTAWLIQACSSRTNTNTRSYDSTNHACTSRTNTNTRSYDSTTHCRSSISLESTSVPSFHLYLGLTRGSFPAG